MIASPARCWQLFTEPERLPPIRAAQVDLDYIYDPDKRQQQANIELLISRIQELGVNTIFLQAFADPDGDGGASSLYFRSVILPMREDLFAPVAQKIREHGIAVYGWLPMLSFSPEDVSDELFVTSLATDRNQAENRESARRMSPFHPRTREMVTRIYRDLGQATHLDGILFHDDGRLTDHEDNSQAALRHYHTLGLPDDISKIQNNPEQFRLWSRYKTKYLVEFTKELLDVVRKSQPWIRSVRNIFASPILNPVSESWFAQSLPLFTQSYDYTAIMAMPFMEKADNPEQWLIELAWSALNSDINPNKIVFELQARDWNSGQPVPGSVLKKQMLLLAGLGATSLAYYPDDLYKDIPPVEAIRACFVSPEPCSTLRTD